MKKILSLIICCLLMQFANAQTDTTQDDGSGFVSVQVEPKFPGGASAWKRYIDRSFNDSLLNLCVKKGEKLRLSIVVSFAIDTTGNLFSTHVESPQEVCPYLAAEAMRVLQQSPKWVPATQNGRKVIWRFGKITITWDPAED